MLTLGFATGAVPAEAAAAREVNIWRDDSGRAMARAFVGATRRWIDWPPFGRFAFGPGGEATVWPSPGVAHDAVSAHFERVLEPLMLQALGWQSLHASAVRNAAGALAFCGRRGAGKSTIAYGMRHSGWTQIADDALVLEAGGSQTMACPLPFTPRFWDESFNHFASGTGALPYKSVAFDRQRVPLRAIFLLNRTDDVQQSRIETVPLMDAFSNLLSHASSFSPHDPAEAKRLVEDYMTIAAGVPVMTLTYSSDFSRLPQVVDAVAHAMDCGADASSPAAASR